jgi:hypothetical protein
VTLQHFRRLIQKVPTNDARSQNVCTVSQRVIRSEEVLCDGHRALSLSVRVIRLNAS